MWRGAGSSCLRSAGAGLGRRQAGAVRGVRAARQGLSRLRPKEPAYYSRMFEAASASKEPGADPGRRRAFAVIRAASEKMIDRIPAAPAGRPR